MLKFIYNQGGKHYMRRIKFACVEQTVQFLPKEDLEPQYVEAGVKEELENFKAKLESSRKKYKILEEVTHPDKSIVIKLKRQYNDYPCGEYLE